MTKMIDEAALLQVADMGDTLPPSRFRMASWWKDTNCGTVGCMIGWWCYLHPEDALTIPMARGDGICTSRPFMEPSITDPLRPDWYLRSYPAIAERFGITVREAVFLFGARCLSYYPEYPDIEYVPARPPLEWLLKEVRQRPTYSRYYERPSETARRIRKFVHYKRLKQPLQDNLELARRREGNWNIVPAVAEMVCV